MGYLTPPSARRGPTNRFGTGINNPNTGGASTQPMGGGIATAYSTSASAARPDPWLEYQARKKAGYVQHRTSGGGSTGGQKTYDYPTFNEPGIPDMRELGDVERYAGEKWAPGETYDSQLVDTGELIAATDKLLQERMGGEMSEAARRFGKVGALESGGGLGGGYVGTLGESERGYRRDYGEMAHRYRFQAEQADEQRRAEAYQRAMDRSLAGHEGYESKRQRDIEMANRFNLDKYGAESGYDWDRYGAELGAAGREQADAIAMMMEMYGG